VRSVYVRRMLPATRYRDLIAPTFVPIVLGAGLALALRLALWGGNRSLGQALAELALFSAVYTLVAVRRERPLLAELVGAFRAERVAVGEGVAVSGAQR
jgi:hypothetical protein